MEDKLNKYMPIIARRTVITCVVFLVVVYGFYPLVYLVFDIAEWYYS